MYKFFNIPALQGLKYALRVITQSILQWSIKPHPFILLTIIFVPLEIYGGFHLFPVQAQERIISDLHSLQLSFKSVILTTFPLMLITFISAVITRRFMFHGGAILEQHQDHDIDDHWPKQQVGYLQGISWFLAGIGCLYLWFAKLISTIVKGICVGITETVTFVLVTAPVFIGSEIIVPLARYFHSTIKYASIFYTTIALCIIARDSFIHPEHRLSRVAVTYFASALSLYAIIKLYSLLDKLGKERAKQA